MSMTDYLLLILIGLYCAYVLFFRKKKGTCCGNCAQCGGCSRKK